MEIKCSQFENIPYFRGGLKIYLLYEYCQHYYATIYQMS